ncbi:hypothetical protein, partial [Bradyrhizobium sp. SZCCHNS3053]
PQVILEMPVTEIIVSHLRGAVQHCHRIPARFIDRVGKGIRGAPRDALIADIAPSAPPELRGTAFGMFNLVPLLRL